MSKTKTNEDFIKELKNTNSMIMPLEKYITAQTKIKFRCLECDNI